MRTHIARVTGVVLSLAVLTASAFAAAGDKTTRDRIADILAEADTPAAETPPSAKAVAKPADGKTTDPTATRDAEQAVDPRDGDPTVEQARRLMRAVEGILTDAAEQRSQEKSLPARDEFIVKPLWTETREDRQDHVRDLLDSALEIVTDVPVVEVQTRIEGLRKTIRELDDQAASLKEKQLTAPKDGLLPGMWTDTVATLGDKIADIEKRIELNKAEIGKAKAEVVEALRKSGVEMSPEQVDLLMDSVLSGDLVRLVATFNAAKLIDAQLGKMMNASGENISAARKYFAMHAALFALLVHAQDGTVRKIDNQYMPRLDAILKDVAVARARTLDLLRGENRPDQKRALEANRDSQKLAEEAAKGYRRYLSQQREQIASARTRATHDLKIADNTFETVEASFQLRNLMRDSASSFEALQKLEAPTFDQIFKNEELRQEFENLTRRLDAPSS